jgi:acyl-CoA synthetase (AMP-forming)/AMP-acid ligase II
VVISGGENIYSSEVENAWYQHPAVLEAAVIGRSDDHWGEVVHAVVVLKSSPQVTGTEWIAHCRDQIAHYKCPKTVEFRTELAKSAASKILKAELRATLRAQSSA